MPHTIRPTSSTSIEINNYKLASWPPSLETRVYHPAESQSPIPSNIIGRDLPAKQILHDFIAVQDPDFHNKLLESTRLFIDLPPAFYHAYLGVQMSGHPIRLPFACQNKNRTVLDCFKDHSAFSSNKGDLHLSKWKTLGWTSLDEYKEWLNTSMLFAFSHSSHYCSAPRVFEADEEQTRTSGTLFHFKQTMTGARSPQKKTNILSVTGFDYRNYIGNIDDTLQNTKKHAKIMLQQILAAALQTDTTDIVFIPVGMGVFLPQGPTGDRIKESMFQGMVEALREYQGPRVTIHCCGWPAFFQRLNSSENTNINCQDKSGYDAYTIANEIQDLGNKGQTQADGKQLKSMLINAADNDWTALLDPRKLPGQFSDGHTLFHRTSDEYYALMMNFAYFSVQRILQWTGFQLDKKIVRTTSRAPDIQSVEESGNSCFTAHQIELIDKFINQLEREINSSWPYPNKDRKQHKVDGLKALKNYSLKTENISDAISWVDNEFSDIRAGALSHRTDELLKTLALSDHTDQKSFGIYP